MRPGGPPAHPPPTHTHRATPAHTRLHLPCSAAAPPHPPPPVCCSQGGRRSQRGARRGGRRPAGAPRAGGAGGRGLPRGGARHGPLQGRQGAQGFQDHPHAAQLGGGEPVPGRGQGGRAARQGRPAAGAPRRASRVYMAPRRPAATAAATRRSSQLSTPPFPVIPGLQVLYLTDPENWTPHAVYQATRMFVSNLNARMVRPLAPPWPPPALVLALSAWPPLALESCTAGPWACEPRAPCWRARPVCMAAPAALPVVSVPAAAADGRHPTLPACTTTLPVLTLTPTPLAAPLSPESRRSVSWSWCCCRRCVMTSARTSACTLRSSSRSKRRPTR
jgi:hypothetical protein